MIVKAENLSTKLKIPLFITCALGSLLVGSLAGLLSGSAGGYDGLVMPPLAPPGIVFPIMWSVLYICIGISLYFILITKTYSPDQDTAKKTALWLWCTQMVFNICWTFVFFTFNLYMFSFAWLCILVAMVVMLIINCFQFTPISAWLNIPYAAWLIFAGYLNLYIALLN